LQWRNRVCSSSWALAHRQFTVNPSAALKGHGFSRAEWKSTRGVGFSP
jgi:hypothetical protein